MTDTSTKTKPILFSAPMVRALLDGRKTQTRRVMKLQPPDWIDCFGYTAFTPKGSISGRGYWKGVPGEEGPGEKFFKSPYGAPGDRLWVRETFALESTAEYDGILDEGADSIPEDARDGRPVRRNVMDDDPGEAWYTIPRYRATEPDTLLMIKEADEPEDQMVWTPSIHMPRWASRITLEITEVRVERLQDISEEDCVAEGVTAEAFKEWLRPVAAKAKTENLCWINTASGDLGEEYCRDCADVKLAELIAAGADPNDTHVDGGWGGGESDSSERCETCGIILESSLTDYAVEEELAHFSENLFNQHPETAYELLNLADGCCSDEQLTALAKIGYRWLWESINGAGSWAANPWMWAISFKVVTA